MKEMTIQNAKEQIAATCRMAWQSGLMRGFSGNASLRLDPDRIMITASGASKGRLEEDDFVIVGKNGTMISGKRKPSIELYLHLGLYSALPGINAILHTHPVYLQALAYLLPDKDVLKLKLPEADYWRERLAFIPEYPPGSAQLADAAVHGLRNTFADSLLLPCAIWLKAHGLCSIGESPDSVLGISEQLEHLAHIHWALLACPSV